MQFNDEETKNLHRKIRKLSFQLKCDLKTTERNIKIYINEDISSPNSNDNNDLQYQIKENMSQNILKEFNMFSKKFKLNEEIYSQKCKELLIIEEDDNMLEMNDMSTNNSDSNENERNRGGGDNFLLTEEPDFVLQSRDNELNEIIRGVTNLQELFRDLQTIVIEQGSILDRIDYNIDIGFNNISKGKKKIIMANEKHKSSCFRNVILFLLLCIFIESMLLLFKIF